MKRSTFELGLKFLLGLNSFCDFCLSSKLLYFQLLLFVELLYISLKDINLFKSGIYLYGSKAKRKVQKLHLTCFKKHLKFLCNAVVLKGLGDEDIFV